MEVAAQEPRLRHLGHCSDGLLNYERKFHASSVSEMSRAEFSPMEANSYTFRRV